MDREYAISVLEDMKASVQASSRPHALCTLYVAKVQKCSEEDIFFDDFLNIQGVPYRHLCRLSGGFVGPLWWWKRENKEARLHFLSLCIEYLKGSRWVRFKVRLKAFIKGWLYEN